MISSLVGVGVGGFVGLWTSRKIVMISIGDRVKLERPVLSFQIRVTSLTMTTTKEETYPTNLAGDYLAYSWRKKSCG
jgi:hypothetical protein